MNIRQSIEVFLGQLIIYISMFLWNDQVGFLLCTIFGAITLALLVISFLVELIEPSKVPSWYFVLMWISLMAPALTLLFFVGLDGFHFTRTH